VTTGQTEFQAVIITNMTMANGNTPKQSKVVQLVKTKPAVPGTVNSGLRRKTFLFYGYAYEGLRRKILYL